MTAGKRFVRRQEKWKAWGRKVPAEEILADKEASALFPQMYHKLEKAMKIREEWDITKEIIIEQYRKDQQEARYGSKIRQISVILLAVFFIFIGLLLLFYVCRPYFNAFWLAGSAPLLYGLVGLLLFLLCEGLICYIYGVFEKED